MARIFWFILMGAILVCMSQGCMHHRSKMMPTSPHLQSFRALAGISEEPRVDTTPLQICNHELSRERVAECFDELLLESTETCNEIAPFVKGYFLCIDISCGTNCETEKSWYHDELEAVQTIFGCKFPDATHCVKLELAKKLRELREKSRIQRISNENQVTTTKKKIVHLRVAEKRRKLEEAEDVREWEAGESRFVLGPLGDVYFDVASPLSRVAMMLIFLITALGMAFAGSARKRFLTKFGHFKK